ncbi:MAG: hypothetical protein ACM31C_34750 [Acidobacteriota bacterium]
MRLVLVAWLLAAAPASAAPDPQIAEVASVDDTSPRSVDAAVKAADALGAARRVDAIPALAALAQKPPTKQRIAAQIAAFRALCKLDTARAKAAAPLRAIATRARPRTKDETTLALHLGVTGAAINALAELRDPKSAPALVHAMYVDPELMMQSRRALVASGPRAKDELRKALRGDNADVNRLFKAQKLDRSCGDDGTCHPVSARDFYAAIVLGDFHDPAVVPDLLAALARPALPAYYFDGDPSPATQRDAIFDALRKLGVPSAAAPVRALWAARDLRTRTLAIGAYPFVARDDRGLDELAQIMADNDADDTLRQEAATAYARLAHDVARIAPLLDLAQKYLDASAKKRAEADGDAKRAAETADHELARAKQKLDAAKQKALAVARDRSTTVDQIKAATEAAKQAEAEFKLARASHKDAVRPYREADAAAKAYRGYARMFQTHVARIAVVLRCKDDLACYGGTLALTPDAAANAVAPWIHDLAAWTADEKLGLVEAAAERAMLELGKRGARAEGQTAALLDAVAGDDRLIRQSILLALPKIAKLPCDDCIAKLDAAIAAGEGKVTLADLQLETQLLRNFFLWAGR